MDQKHRIKGSYSDNITPKYILRFKTFIQYVVNIVYFVHQSVKAKKNVFITTIVIQTSKVSTWITSPGTV